MSSSQFSASTVAFKTAIPAFLCLFGTFLQAAGLIFLPVSVYQMLASSIIMFSAIVRFFWMGKGLARFEACGIVLTALGLTLVGIASIVSGEGSSSQSSVGMLLVGIVLELSAQAVLAFEAVMEERLLHGFSAPPEFVCGIVGSWGLLYTCVIFLPIAQFINGDEGNGLHEDSIETLNMIMDSPTIRLLLLIFFVAILLYNLMFRLLISITQATTMQVLGGLRTLCVWVVALLMYFEWPQYGEKWAASSWIELSGFFILMFGVFLYRATFKLPCFEYQPPNDAMRQPPNEALITLQQDAEEAASPDVNAVAQKKA